MSPRILSLGSLISQLYLLLPFLSSSLFFGCCLGVNKEFCFALFRRVEHNNGTERTNNNIIFPSKRQQICSNFKMSRFLSSFLPSSWVWFTQYFAFCPMVIGFCLFASARAVDFPLFWSPYSSSDSNWCNLDRGPNNKKVWSMASRVFAACSNYKFEIVGWLAGLVVMATGTSLFPGWHAYADQWVITVARCSDDRYGWNTDSKG